jgi:tol-pal system protein YbgF
MPASYIRAGRKSWIFVALLTWGSCACWVKEEEGKRMQAEITALQVEFEVVKKSHAQQKAKLQERLEEADRRIAELVRIIEDYRRAMGRNAADIGVDIEKIKSQLMELRGRMEVGEHRLESIEKKLSMVNKDITSLNTKTKERLQQASNKRNKPKLQPPDPLAGIKRPEKKEDFYKLAYTLLETGQTEASRALFKEFLEKWPSSAYSDNALYWMAESYYSEKKYRQAALTFQKVRSQYPKGDKASDSLFKLGYCFFAMERYREAEPFLGEFIRSYPKSPLVSKAKKKLREAKRKLRAKSKSK